MNNNIESGDRTRHPATEGIPAKESYETLTFREALLKVFPQTRDTPVCSIVAGLLVSAKELLIKDKKYEKAHISESAALILYHPSEKGSQVPARAGLIKSAVENQESVSPLVLKAIEGLSQGPDLDIKLEFEPDHDFEEFLKAGKEFLAKAMFEESSQPGKSRDSLGADDLTLEARELAIPVYDEDNPQVQEKLQRPLLELFFRKKDGSLILKVHLTSTPEPWDRFKAECRLGMLTSFKQCYTTLPLIFPEEKVKQGKDYSEILMVKLDSQVKQKLPLPDWYPTYGVGSELAIGKPTRYLIGSLRMMIIALLTQKEEHLKDGSYLWGPNKEKMKEIFSAIKERGNKRLVPEEARQEIMNCFFLACLLDADLFLKMARELEVLGLVKAGESDSSFQRVKEVVRGIIKADPENIVSYLNGFSELFGIEEI